MACPYFMPMQKLAGGAWLHEHRLPLGCGWSGQCTAPAHEGEIPSQEEMRDFCNLGYASSCARLPRERSWDSVRFGVKNLYLNGESVCERVQLHYVCEREHRPIEHGFLEFDAITDQWPTRHSDTRVQRMAECYLAAYFEKRKSQAAPLAS